MSRRLLRILTVLAVVSFIAFGLQLPRLTGWLIRTRLAAAFERPTRLSEVRFELAPLRVVVRGLAVGGFTPEAPPFIEVREITARPSLGTLWSPRLALGQLRLDGLTIRINAFPDGGDDIPKPQAKGGGGRLEVGRLIVADGEFRLNHRRVPLNLDLPDFRGQLTSQGAGALAGRITFGPGGLRFSDAPLLPVSTDIEMLLSGGVVTVESAHLTAEGTDLRYAGQVRIAARPVGALSLAGPINLDVLERHVMRTGFGIKGAGQYDGTVYIDGSRLTLKGRLWGTEGVFDGAPVPRYAGELDWDGEGVHILGLDVDALGGHGVMDIDIPSGPRIATWSGEIESADGEGLLKLIFDMGAPGLATAASGRFSIRWPKGRFRAGLSGQMTVGLDPVDDERTPLSGHLDWRAEDGAQFLEPADLRTPTTHAWLRGTIGADNSAKLLVEAESSDLADSDRLGWQLRLALGNPEAQKAGITGRGAFRGTWGGTLAEPLYEGRVTASEVGYLGVVWGNAEWAGSADPYEIRSHSLVLRRPDGAEMWIDGTTELGFYGLEDGLDVKVRYRDWPASDFLTAFAWDLDVEAPVTGTATVAGRRSAPRGRAELASAGGRYYGIPFEAFSADSRYDGGLTRGSGRARIGDGEVRFSGIISDDGHLDGEATLDGVDVGKAFPELLPSLPWGGALTGSALLQGPLDRPRLTGSVGSPRLHLGDEELGVLSARAQGLGGGAVSLAARCDSARVDLALSGQMEAFAPYRIDLRLTAEQTHLGSFLRVVRPQLPAGVEVVSTGRLTIGGPLLTPDELTLDAVVPALVVRLPDYTVANRTPLHLSVEHGRLELHDLQLAGEGTDLAIDGSAALLENGPVDLAIRGAADLRALSAITRRLRGQGDALLAVTVGGTRDQPQVSGMLQLDGAGVRARGFPHGIDDVRGVVSFTERAAQFKEITGVLGGGQVVFSGEAAYGPAGLSTFEVEATGRELSFRYPEGLRSQLDADIRFFGDADEQWVTGEIDVRQATWTRRYDLASELLASHEGLAPTAALEPGVRYDIKVRAPGTLRLDNNLANLRARADLRIQGSSTQPVILGRAEIEGGRVYFQGNTYIIRRGTIDFSNPERIDPRFDIEAETRIQSYRVTLRMNGTLERVSPTLTSDPPLSAVQILSLLAGADESAVASLTQVQADQANLVATGAATLAAGRISEEVGLEREAERLFGLNRFSIDPSVIKGGVSNPSARLTVGKRITPDLNVLYSIDLRGQEDQVISVEYSLSDRLLLLVTRSQNPSELAFDLRLIRSF